MGHYTSLRIKLRPKDEYRELYQFIFDNADSPSTWSDAAKTFPYKFLKDWEKVNRCDFIPFGALVGSDWDENDPEWELAFDDQHIFQFQCSLKNYEEEIETWVLLFKETWIAIDGWVWYEDSEEAARLEECYDLD